MVPCILSFLLSFEKEGWEWKRDQVCDAEEVDRIEARSLKNVSC